MIRDINGLIKVFPQEEGDIRDIHTVLKGRLTDRTHKRAILGVDLSEEGAIDVSNIIDKVNKLRELENRPDPITEARVRKALYLIRAIWREMEEKGDHRFRFTVTYGTFGPNATGEARFFIKEYAEVFHKGDHRLPAITAGDNQNLKGLLSRQDYRCKFCENMYKTASDPIQQSEWKIKFHQESIVYEEMKLAQKSPYS